MDAEKLVKAYIRIRTAKDELVKRQEEELAKLQEQLAVIEGELLTLCKETGQDGGKTQYGTFTRTVKTRYWTNDWASMYKFINENNALELLEQRLHQTNLKSFLKENPGKLPAGLNADSKYSITVRRPSNSAS